MMELKEHGTNITQHIHIGYSDYTEGYILYQHLLDLLDIDKFNIEKKVGSQKYAVNNQQISFTNYGESYFLKKDNNKIMVGSDMTLANHGFFSLTLYDKLIIDSKDLLNYRFVNTIKSLTWLQSYYLLLNLQYLSPSYDYIAIEGKRDTFENFGFNIYWTFVVDYITPDKTKIPKEVLLKAPGFMVKELDSGSVYVRLTEEEPSPYDFVEEFVDAYLEFYNYCKEHI